MAKEYRLADDAEMALLESVLLRWHQMLEEEQLRIAVAFIRPPKGKPAITHQGSPATAQCRVATRYERMLASMAGVIEIDEDRWDELPLESQEALLDHELTHLAIDRDGQGELKRHEDGSVKLKLRPDDWTLTGFASVLERHGKHALEAMAFSKVHDVYQREFGFMEPATQPSLAVVG